MKSIKLILCLLIVFSFSISAWAGKIHDAAQKGELEKVKTLLNLYYLDNMFIHSLSYILEAIFENLELIVKF